MTIKVVYIMGTGHCGSTLLDLILGSHSKAMSFAELHTISQIVNGKDRTSHFCRTCIDECRFWNRTVDWNILGLLYNKKNMLRKFLSKSLRSCVSPYVFFHYWTGKDVLIDSSKNPDWLLSQLPILKIGPKVDVTLIYILRDGRAVVNSYFRKYPQRGIKEIIQNWKRQVLKMNSFYEKFDYGKKMKIRYEDLATTPRKMVREICDLIEVQFEPNMLNYWEQEHHPISGNWGTVSLMIQNSDHKRVCQNSKEKQIQNETYYQAMGPTIKLDLRWQTELTQEQISIFENLAGDLNKDFVPNEKSIDS